MHPRNIHNKDYDLQALSKSHKKLKPYVHKNKFGFDTIDFSNQEAVLHLNKAILKHHYQLPEWNLPATFLCPPIPGRADYIHHIADILLEDPIDFKMVKGVDIGVGANCIFPILGARIYGWKMLGADINLTAVTAARANVKNNPGLEEKIEIRHQKDPGSIFKGIIKEGESYDFSLCNPPFHPSEEAATKATLRKLKNLGIENSSRLNFGGQANELWCNGGEALFIKRMIKESVGFKTQIRWFSSLVSKKENLPKIYKQLKKINAVHKTIEMAQGNKKSRFIAWKFE